VQFRRIPIGHSFRYRFATDVSRILPRTRQRPVHVLRVRHVLCGDPNQPLSADQHRHVDDVLHFRHRVRGWCIIPLSLSTGNQKQVYGRHDVTNREINVNGLTRKHVTLPIVMFLDGTVDDNDQT